MHCGSMIVHGHQESSRQMNLGVVTRDSSDVKFITRTALHAMQMHAGTLSKQSCAKLWRLVCVLILPNLTSLHHGS